MIRDLSAAQSAMRERNLSKKQIRLQEEQERMREEQEIQRSMDEELRTWEFRQRVEALFMEYGKTREEAQTFWLRAIFGPTITEIKSDIRLWIELHRRGFNLSERPRRGAGARHPQSKAV